MAINVHLSPCNDCRFHDFPYKAKPPLVNYGEQLFENDDALDEAGMSDKDFLKLTMNR